jgi:hypothetical protein
MSNTSHIQALRGPNTSKEKIMKRFIVIGFVAALLFAVRAGSAQVISFDENGKGTFGTVTLPVTPSSPPVYHLAVLLGYVPTPGDVLVTEGANTAQLDSDLLRFDPNGNLTVFSDREATDLPPLDLADVGIPTPIAGLPFITLPETDLTGKPAVEGGINGLFGYMPGPGMPGGSPTGALGATYNFTSDVPEPASLSVLGIGACALLSRRGRRTA